MPEVTTCHRCKMQTEHPYRTDRGTLCSTCVDAIRDTEPALVLDAILGALPADELIEALAARCWDVDSGLATLGAWRAKLSQIEDDLGEAAAEARDHRAACRQHGA